MEQDFYSYLLWHMRHATSLANHLSKDDIDEETYKTLVSDFKPFEKNLEKLAVNKARVDEDKDDLVQTEKDIFSLDMLKKEIIDIFSRQHQGFGRGRFYQSFQLLGLDGQRDTQDRLKTYNFYDIIAGKTILDIGCNCGFFDLQIAPYVKHLDGVEFNETLVKIADCVKKYLKIKNAEFFWMDFNKFNTEKIYDVVFAFAVHRWIGMTPADYAKRMHSLISPKGHLVFESHHIGSNDKDEELYNDSFLQAFEDGGFNRLREGTIKDHGIIKDGEPISRRWYIYEKI